jgi:hypothetical protein
MVIAPSQFCQFWIPGAFAWLGRRPPDTGGRVSVEFGPGMCSERFLCAFFVVHDQGHDQLLATWP